MIGRSLLGLAIALPAPALGSQIFTAYPAVALQQKQQGLAAVALIVEPSGQVSNCIVTHGSGSAELDKATCAIAAKRSFPAQEEQVRRVRTQLVRWIIPGEPQPEDTLFTPAADFIIAEPGVAHPPHLSGMWQPARDPLSQNADNITALLLVAVEADGKLDHCAVLRATGMPDLDMKACDIVTNGRAYKPASDAAGDPVASWVGIPWTFQAQIPAGYPVNPAARDSLPGTFSAVQPVRQEFWFANDDYPPESVRAHEQGEVIVDARISTDGRAGSCQVTLSSGFPMLDDGTCRLLTRRALFIPARDLDGKSIAGIFRQRMSWTLTNGGPPSKADTLKSSLSVAKIPTGLVSAPFSIRYLTDEKGHVVRCEPVRSSGLVQLDQAACKQYLDGANQAPFNGPDGKPERVVRTEEVLLTLAP